jgi:ABC-type transport system involved in multi-copper enzyme maturation permease subunit
VKISAVAANTFREAIRDKILYNLVFFALLIMGTSVVLGKLTLGEREKIIQDVSLAAMSVFGLLIAIFVGIGLVHKEIQRRTIYTLLAKPVSRWQFVLGKYLGLLLTIVINVAVMSVALFVLMLFFSELGPNWGLGKAIVLIMMELMVVTAVAVFFSTFTTPTLAAMYTLGVWVIGRFSSDLMTFAGKIKVPGLKLAITVGHYLLPNLEKFDVKDLVVYRMPVSTDYVLASLGYGLIYIVLLMLLAIAIFERRDFK